MSERLDFDGGPIVFEERLFWGKVFLAVVGFGGAIQFVIDGNFMLAVACVVLGASMVGHLVYRRSNPVVEIDEERLVFAPMLHRSKRRVRRDEIRSVSMEAEENGPGRIVVESDSGEPVEIELGALTEKDRRRLKSTLDAYATAGEPA